MTLTEYLSQTDAVPMPNVVLSTDEYSLGPFIGIPDFRTARVFVEKLSGTYAVKEGGTRLYVEKEGRLSNISCFSIQSK